MVEDEQKTCCFTGHRIISKSEVLRINEKLEKVCKSLIKQGYCRFICGGALGFDTIAALCVLRMRQEYDIKLIIAVPCRNQSEHWKKSEIETYEKILGLADEVTVLSEKYTSLCMQNRNRFMVDRSSVCIAYLNRTACGTAKTVSYAVDKGCEIIFV